MSLTICFYEDSRFNQFYPLTYLRPVYFLRPGMLPIYQRAEKHFPQASISFASRSQISSLISQSGKEASVNIIRKGEGDVLFLNGRIRDYGDLSESVRGCRLNTIFKNNGETIGVLFKADSIKSVSDLSTPEIYREILPKLKSVTAIYDTKAKLYNYLWEMVDDINESLLNDFKQMEAKLVAAHNPKIHDGCHFINDKDIYLDNDVEIFPTAVIDASAGPIYIGANTKVQPQAHIIGPGFIGANAVVLQGKITGSSIGPTSRVGGEIEASIFHSYVNKYHAGFIGHSFVGSWVNFGALTTNSDLKNNYSNIKVNVNGVSTNTGSIKVGSFIGDHTKFGIGMLLNTGITVGVSCNLFGGTLLSEREVASFSWGSTGHYKKYDINDAISTIKTVMDRRNCQLSSKEEETIRAVHNNEISSEGCLDF